MAKKLEVARTRFISERTRTVGGQKQRKIGDWCETKLFFDGVLYGRYLEQVGYPRYTGGFGSLSEWDMSCDIVFDDRWSDRLATGYYKEQW